MHEHDAVAVTENRYRTVTASTTSASSARICSGAAGTMKPASAAGQVASSASLASRSPMPPACTVIRGTAASDSNGVAARARPAAAAADAPTCPAGRVCQRAAAISRTFLHVACGYLSKEATPDLPAPQAPCRGRDTKALAGARAAALTARNHRIQLSSDLMRAAVAPSALRLAGTRVVSGRGRRDGAPSPAVS